MNLAFISTDEAKTFIFLILLRSISFINPPASLIKTIPATANLIVENFATPSLEPSGFFEHL